MLFVQLARIWIRQATTTHRIALTVSQEHTQTKWDESLRLTALPVMPEHTQTKQDERWRSTALRVHTASINPLLALLRALHVGLGGIHPMKVSCKPWNPALRARSGCTKALRGRRDALLAQ